MRFLETQSEQGLTGNLHMHFVTAREALLPSAPESAHKKLAVHRLPRFVATART
jgi:hypothetical protein